MIHSNEMAQKCAPRENSINQSIVGCICTWSPLICYHSTNHLRPSARFVWSEQFDIIVFMMEMEKNMAESAFYQMRFHHNRASNSRQLPHKWTDKIKTAEQKRMNMFGLIQTDVYRHNGHMYTCAICRPDLDSITKFPQSLSERCFVVVFFNDFEFVFRMIRKLHTQSRQDKLQLKSICSRTLIIGSFFTLQLLLCGFRIVDACVMWLKNKNIKHIAIHLYWMSTTLRVRC